MEHGLEMGNGGFCDFIPEPHGRWFEEMTKSRLDSFLIQPSLGMGRILTLFRKRSADLQPAWDIPASNIVEPQGGAGLRSFGLSRSQAGAP
jgi:hypothetical protein